MGKTVLSIKKLTREAALVEVVNSIQDRYPKLRQKSKAVTFAAQYQGTYRTFMNASGFSETDAKALEASYKDLYKVSENYTAEQIKLASTCGYTDVAFGLRIRAPLLGQVVWGTPNLPKEAVAEGRTLGNALSQSYGLLNSRSANEFMGVVRKSKYCLDVLPISHIHDAQYYLVKDSVEIISWVNKELIKTMEWQELPEIKHPDVTLGAELEVHYRGWHEPVTIPNHATQAEIIAICDAAKQKYLKETT